jgi:anti-sigma regulatory factor (Ser/Thr protein kinase)
MTEPGSPILAMTKTSDSAAPDSDGFVRVGVPADAHSVVRLREELEQWLRRGFALDALRLNDLVLSVNEALANVAEFAYRNVLHTGTVDVQAQFDRVTSALVITVADQGSWRGSAEREPMRTRGRGIPLMEALSDEVDIDTGDHGTTVSMRFGNVSPRAACLGGEVATA